MASARAAITPASTRAPALRRIFASPGTRPSIWQRLDPRVHAGDDGEAFRRPAAEPGERETACVLLVRGENVVEALHGPEANRLGLAQLLAQLGQRLGADDSV